MPEEKLVEQNRALYQENPIASQIGLPRTVGTVIDKLEEDSLVEKITRSHEKVQDILCNGPSLQTNFVIQGGHASPGLLSSLKLRMASLLAPSFGRNGPLWEVRVIENSTRDRRGTSISSPFLCLSPPFWVSKEHQRVSIRKT